MPSDRFNRDIYNWSMRAIPGKWHSLENIRMDKGKFIDAVKYLIECGEPLEFNKDFTKVRRELKIDWITPKQTNDET